MVHLCSHVSLSFSHTCDSHTPTRTNVIHSRTHVTHTDTHAHMWHTHTHTPMWTRRCTLTELIRLLFRHYFDSNPNQETWRNKKVVESATCDTNLVEKNLGAGKEFFESIGSRKRRRSSKSSRELVVASEDGLQVPVQPWHPGQHELTVGKDWKIQKRNSCLRHQNWIHKVSSVSLIP